VPGQCSGNLAMAWFNIARPGELLSSRALTVWGHAYSRVATLHNGGGGSRLVKTIVKCRKLSLARASCSVGFRCLNGDLHGPTHDWPGQPCGVFG